MFFNYKFKVDLKFKNDGKVTGIDTENIQSITINYDYTNNNFPIILAHFKAKRSLIRDIVLNKHKALFQLTILKFKEKDVVIDLPYIKTSDYIYFITEEAGFPDYLKENPERDGSGMETIKQITIGLINLDCLNKSRLFINGVYSNIDNMKVILHHFSDLRLLIEPLNASGYDELLIPPINSKLKLLQYLNNRTALYNTPYRFFIDFDKSYLISSSTVGVPSKDEKYNNCSINVSAPSENDNSQFIDTGMEEDDVNKVYKLNISGTEININVDNTIDKKYNKIIGIDSLGQTMELNININNSTFNNTRSKIIRLSNNNFKELNQLKNGLENSSISLGFVKNGIDTSQFTINKKYSFKLYDIYKHLNGDYLLNNKSEVYLNENNNFICQSVFSFKKPS